MSFLGNPLENNMQDLILVSIKNVCLTSSSIFEASKLAFSIMVLRFKKLGIVMAYTIEPFTSLPCIFIVHLYASKFL